MFATNLRIFQIIEIISARSGCGYENKPAFIDPGSVRLREQGWSQMDTETAVDVGRERRFGYGSNPLG